MNGYELSRDWWNFCFENPEKIKPNHTALYFFCIEHCNRLGWKEKFGLPTEMAKEAIGIKSYNTYKKTLIELVDFGFIIMIENSKNQFSSNIIALSKFNKAHNKAHNKALDKAMMKHGTKQSESTAQSTGESIDSINKPITNKPINIEHTPISPKKEIENSSKENSKEKKQTEFKQREKPKRKKIPQKKEKPEGTVLSVFNRWNEANIIVHKELNETEAIKKAIKQNGLNKVLEAISNYSEILNDTEFYFDHRWSLATFLKKQRGKQMENYRRFLSGGDFYENYKNQNNGKSIDRKTNLSANSSKQASYNIGEGVERLTEAAKNGNTRGSYSHLQSNG